MSPEPNLQSHGGKNHARSTQKVIVSLRKTRKARNLSFLLLHGLHKCKLLGYAPFADDCHGFCWSYGRQNARHFTDMLTGLLCLLWWVSDSVFLGLLPLMPRAHASLTQTPTVNFEEKRLSVLSLPRSPAIGWDADWMQIPGPGLAPAYTECSAGIQGHPEGHAWQRPRNVPGWEPFRLLSSTCNR